METSGIEVYNCKFCGQSIHYHEPRYHCISCVDYNLCASCKRNGQFSGGHTNDHIYQRIQAGVSTSSGFPLVGSGTVLQYPGLPNPFWDRMIMENRAASDRFRRLIDSIHHFISWTRVPQTGNLEPEKASYIVALLDYPEEDNIFHLFLTHSRQNRHGLVWSDYQTLLIYQRCGWEYQQGTRDHQQQIASVQPEFQLNFTPVEGGMPLLTRRGLVDMMVTEALADPQVFRERFNALLRKINGSQRALRDLQEQYEFPTEPIGSNCWPVSPDQEAVETRAIIQKEARARAASAAEPVVNPHETMNQPSDDHWDHHHHHHWAPM
ncbi:hypothetical protein L873DRAFT_1788857 [Choiromyces venosus 120613-1]|uniref:ZZ-type domain-containing protein n=1 Tax=Choiromyces venosus 120613-1 TaxID=1336337 RepID=A0A3N4JU19_9PEZI|nr:hypothetical protein L873DRAFT_1788857 [Choiromyces venosus 120613-1]